MISTIIIFTAILSLLVFVHEFGHFITAKKAGVRVEEFGFGFPPRIGGIKKGDTIYSINWVPLGGFVKIKGESGEHSKDKDSFANKGPWQRGLILCAGVLMNVVLAWALLTFGFMIGMPQIIEDLSPFARVRDEKVQVISVLEGTPAEEAGIEPGDTIVSLDGRPVKTFEDVRSYAEPRRDVPVAVAVKKDGETEEKTITPAFIAETGKTGFGIGLVQTGLVSYPWYIAPLEGAHATYVFTKDILLAFGDLIRDLFVQRKVTVEFSGPVGIAVLTAEVAKLGLSYLIQFTALLSLNLAIINILPFPALDGGRVLFLVVERLRGKAVSRKIEAVTHNIGFALLMTLVLVITYRDVVKFGDRIFDAIGRLFGV